MYWSHEKLHREVRILRTMKVRSNKHHQQKERRPFEEPVSRLTKLGDKVLDPPTEKHTDREKVTRQADRWPLELPDNRGPNNTYMGKRSEERVRNNN